MARFPGIHVAAISIVTNYAVGTETEPLSHEHTMCNAALALEDARRLATHFSSEA